MRKFNDREKGIIKILCSININNFAYLSLHLQEKYFTKDRKHALFINPKEKYVIYFLEKEVFEIETEKNRKAFEFLELLGLIKYLKENRLITIFPNTKINDGGNYALNDSFSKIDDTTQADRIILNDDGLYLLIEHPSNIFNSTDDVVYTGLWFKKENGYEIITDSLLGLTLVSEELKYLAQNNFETDEEKRFKKIFIATWAGIIVALIIGLIGLFNPLTTCVKIETTQFDSLLQKKDKSLKTDLNSFETLKMINKKQFQKDTLTDNKY